MATRGLRVRRHHAVITNNPFDSRVEENSLFLYSSHWTSSVVTQGPRGPPGYVTMGIED